MVLMVAPMLAASRLRSIRIMERPPHGHAEAKCMDSLGKVETASCCKTPEPDAESLDIPRDREAVSGKQAALAEGAPDDTVIPAGEFRMGDHLEEGYPADGEGPVHTVFLDAYSIGTTAVSNTDFAAFVADTGYRTDAERYGSSAVFHLLIEAPEADVIGSAAGAPWWLRVRGADWAHPSGRGSDWRDIPEHPAVHISYFDALAYCTWAGRKLPSEAQWEKAARGGLCGKRFAWGDELRPGGEHRCNIWQGEFPVRNSAADGFLGTAPVKSFRPNGYGVYQMAGNIWEWCADWFLPTYYAHSPEKNPKGPPFGTGRVIRGGSYLCHDSYCNRYRVAARSFNTPESSSGNCGFRTVAQPEVSG